MSSSIRIFATFAILLVCCSMFTLALEDQDDSVRVKRQWGYGGYGMGMGMYRPWGMGMGMYRPWGMGMGMYRPWGMGGYGWGR